MNAPATDRIRILHQYSILDTPRDHLADKVAALAAELCGVPNAAITLIDEDRQWFKAWHGMEPTRTKLNESICATICEAPQFFIMRDGASDPDLHDHPAIACDNGIRFYAAAPLMSESGHSLGAVCVYDTKPGDLSTEQCRSLHALADVAMGLFEAHKRSVDFKDERNYLTALADNSPGGLFEFSMDGSGRQWISFASRGVCDTMGVTPEDAIADFGNVGRHIHPEDLAGFAASIQTAYDGRQRWEHIFRVDHPTRGPLSIMGMSHPISSGTDVVTWQGCVMDVTDRVQEQRDIEEAQAKLEAQFEVLNEYQALMSQIGRLARVGAWSMDIAGRTVNWTPDVYQMFDLQPGSDVTMQIILDHCVEPGRSEVADQVGAAIEFGTPIKLEFQIATARGVRRWLRSIGEAQFDESGRPARLLGSIQDISRERHLLERVRHHASHDPLTGLANRSRLASLLSERIAIKPAASRHALAFIDIDHFKDVNDALGYEAGDRFLSVIGSRLRAMSSRDGRDWLPGRFGGDEFALLLTDVPEGREASLHLADVIKELVADIDMGGTTITPNVSVGLAIYPYDGQEGATLFRRADLALRHAKHGGRSRTCRFDPSLEVENENNQALRRDMLRGIELNEFELYFQPIIDLSSDGLHGFEALMRWHHPEKGLVSAAEFAHLMDEPAIGLRLSNAAIDQTIRAVHDWDRQGVGDCRVALNISSSQLRNPGFHDQICRILAAGIPSSRIKLEITENVLLGRTATKAAQVLADLNSLGFEISLDDFGTGYASLVHLTQFPISQIKIDMSFVRKMLASRQDRTIVQTMCSLAGGLDMTSVAEGVEDAEVEQLLRLAGCRYGQGYFYSPAISAQAAAEFALSRKGESPSGGARRAFG